MFTECSLNTIECSLIVTQGIIWGGAEVQVHEEAARLDRRDPSI